MAARTMLCALLLLQVAGTLADEHSVYGNEFYSKLADLEIAANMTDKQASHHLLPPVGTQYECNLPSSPDVPTSVHQLRPGDIKWVTGVGDSITAAFGAKSSTIITIQTEYRGIAWSMGGDDTIEKVTTVPNFMKKFNPQVQGWSIKTGKATSANSRYNRAISGAIAKDIPGQVRGLVEKMKADPELDYENDWKLLTIWIGGNDLCRVCKNDPDHNPENYILYVQQALDYLHIGDGESGPVPRLFVNMVQILDVSRLSEVSGILCSIVHFVACSCATTDGESAREKVRVAALEYQRLTNDLVMGGRYDTRDDFTVVLQPFFIETQVPKKDGKADTSFFAPDCFHFSGKGHAASAVALWNNMLQPVGLKSVEWNLGEEPICPNEAQPYLFTRLNSPAISSNVQLSSGATGNDPAAQPLSTNTTKIAVASGCASLALVTMVAALFIVKRKKTAPLTERTPLVPPAAEPNV